ncbi:MAG TPA: murein L,D-transpeptidase, partial [Thermopetrobacter sp.]|nr:murein L,D-transpeptidase [Thermopetrobacter sp.]
SKRYDRQVAAAVLRYQRNMGLRQTGHVDRPTLKQLNISAAARLETLMANLPRMEWAIAGLAPRYIVVNIPAAQLETVEEGRVHSRHNVIVGMPDRPSPSLLSRISELNFNPYWNAPLSIVIKDIIPKARKDPRFLKRMRIRVFDGYGGPEVDPRSIDWNNIDPRRYHFRQEPGKGNAMASVKINFPNRYSVYLHDTPTPQLFTESARYFSSGCVRVERVHILTEWILRDMPGWDRERIRRVVKSRERLDVKVVNPPSLIIAYLTAWVTGDGQAHFRDDIYRLDGTGFVHGQPQPVTAFAGTPG